MELCLNIHHYIVCTIMISMRSLGTQKHLWSNENLAAVITDMGATEKVSCVAG